MTPDTTGKAAAKPTLRHVRAGDLTPQEAEGVRRVTLGAYAEYAELMPGAAWQGLKNAVTTTLDRQLEPGSPDASADLFIAQRRGDILASVMLFSPESDAYKGAVDTPYPEIRLLAVDERARGSGLGKALVKMCIRHARKAGARAVGLHTSDRMTVATGLYTSLGFERVPELDFGANERVKAYRLRLDSERP